MEEKNENPVEEVVQKEQPIVDEAVGKVKVKPKKFSNYNGEDDVYKVDMTKNEETKDVEESTTDDAGVAGSDEATDTAPQQEEVQAESETQESPVLEEITEETVEEVKEEVVSEEKPSVELPENLDKLVSFMNETGGTVEDYVELNKDYSEMDNLTALREYYKATKPHLDAEEIQFLMDETFSYDEEIDEAKDIRKKKIALKEQVAEAKAYLDGQKSKYYDEIKARPTVNNEYQKAMDFFNRHNKESEERQSKFNQAKEVFDNKTNNLFSGEFKGFEFNVGEKKFRFGVKDTDKVKTSQSDINNFVKKFLSKEGVMEDAAGYHKGLYTAMNADSVAKHFYEQGKADALKESIEKSKNINMNPRQVNKEVEVGGIKYRVLSGDSSSDFKFKIKNKK